MTFGKKMKSPFVIIVGIAVVIVALYSATRSSRSPQASTFTGDPSNDKDIVVAGWTESELRRILADFEKLYPGRLGSTFTVAFRTVGSSIKLTFPNDIPAEEFGFLVNYIYYPEASDLKGRTIIAAGSSTLSENFRIPDKDYSGRKALFYVPSNDQEYDLVYVRIGDLTFENSFASTKWKPRSDPRLPPGILSLK